MTQLKNAATEDLINRWNLILQDYIKHIADYEKLLKKIDLSRQELLLIREELRERNIQADGVLSENE